jgi:hypothetical protein
MCATACSTSIANATAECVDSACTFTCNSGYTLCNGACVNFTSDDNNCGGCGSAYACSGNAMCENSVCTCPASAPTVCSGECVNTTSNVNDCGTCTNLCPSPGVANASAACVDSACTFACDSGYSSCNGGCADFSTDNNNCGGCGAECDETCQGGACIVPFGYTPSNFTPTSYTPPSGATTDCNAAYSSTSHTFTTGSCAGAAPTIYSNVAQVGGGPVVDILAFSSLTIATGSTLTLTGTNPVILTVYGNATINGTVNANASGATPGAGGDNSAYCVAAAAGTGGNNGASGGGGGGKAVAGGTGSCGGQSCGSPYTIAGGGVSSTLLTGGCAGGVGEASFPNSTPTNPAGAGGGGVQIAASGTITGTGSITASGSAGTAGGTGQFGKGGGGGGSGGYVVLECSQATAPSLTLAANGGAGGAATGSGGTAGTNNGTTQVAPGNATLEHNINDDGGGGGGAYGYVVVNLE